MVAFIDQEKALYGVDALTLTADGGRVYRKAVGLIERHEAKIAESLSDAERAQLLDLLGRVQRAAATRR